MKLRMHVAVTGQIDALCEVQFHTLFWEPMSSDSGLAIEGVRVFAVGLFDGVDIISFSACDLK